MENHNIYRPEIDGLRALAVVPVILFHAGLSAFSGGFVGVDIFFVISGYLITTIILRDLETKSFSILSFYERRARRILPALFLVVGVSFIPAWFLMFPEELQDFGQSAWATAAFGSNILFWQTAGYFSPVNEMKPLLHTWSLGVEEQYYVIFPLAFLLLWSRGLRHKAIFVVFAVTVIAGFFLADWGASRYKAASFFLLPTRAWELLTGALLAMFLAKRQPLRGWGAEVGALLGIGLITVAIAFLNETYPWPGRWALLPVCGTVLIILCAGPLTVVGRGLAWKPMVGLGLVSYSAYLWHQPVFAFARLASPTGHPGPYTISLLIAATFLIAWVSWRYVEQPFRNPVFFPGKAVAVFAGIGTVAMISGGLLVQVGGGWPDRFTSEVQQLIAVAAENGRGREGCSSAPEMPDNGCRFSIPDEISERARVLLWGDSHAMALAEALAGNLGENGIALETITLSGCPPIFGVDRIDRDCIEANEAALTYIEGPESPDVIVVHAYWPVYTQGTTLEDPNQLVLAPTTISLMNDAGTSLELPRDVHLVLGNLETTLRRIGDNGKKVFVVGSVPEAGYFLPRYMARRALLGQSTDVSANSDIAELRRAPADTLFERLEAEGLLMLLRPSDLFCEEAQNFCTLHIGSTPLYRDNNHLSVFGSTMIGESLGPHLVHAADSR